MGDSADVWLDAVYVTPECVGQLEAIELYGIGGLLFDSIVTQDLRNHTLTP